MVGVIGVGGRAGEIGSQLEVVLPHVGVHRCGGATARRCDGGIFRCHVATLSTPSGHAVFGVSWRGVCVSASLYNPNPNLNPLDLEHALDPLDPVQLYRTNPRTLVPQCPRSPTIAQPWYATWTTLLGILTDSILFDSHDYRTHVMICLVIHVHSSTHHWFNALIDPRIHGLTDRWVGAFSAFLLDAACDGLCVDEPPSEPPSRCLDQGAARPRYSSQLAARRDSH